MNPSPEPSSKAASDDDGWVVSMSPVAPAADEDTIEEAMEEEEEEEEEEIPSRGLNDEKQEHGSKDHHDAPSSEPVGQPITSHNNFYKRLKLMIIWIVIRGVFVVVFVVFVGVGIWLHNYRQIPPTYQRPAPLPTTPDFETTPYRTVAFDELVAVLGNTIGDNDDENSNSTGIFWDPETPQYRALDWLANHDKWYYEKGGDPSQISLQALHERYSLAVFYFSLGGPSWPEPTSFLTPLSVCDWKNMYQDVPAAERWGVWCSYEHAPVVNELTAIRDILQGSIPTEIALLSHLNSVKFVSNPGLNGTIPAQIGQLTTLSEIFISDCSLSGIIPTEIGLLTNLRLLELEGNKMTGTIPTELGRLSELWYLNLKKNKMSGALPRTMGGCKALDFLELSSNKFRGPLPTELGRLFKLYYVNLNRNMITGTIPTEFGQLLELVHIHAENNQLTGTIPREIGGCSNLQDLSLKSNHLQSPIPTELCELPMLETLDLSTNDLTAFPVELANCDSALRILLNSNRIQGTLPNRMTSGICNILQSMEIQNNEMTGTIPTEVGNCDNHLNQFVLASNNFSGPLPSELGQLIQLAVLDVHNNSVTGTIPSELGKISRLYFMNLNHNKITGTIPTEFGQLSRLAYIHADHNELTGMIPRQIGTSTSLQELWLQSNQLQSPIPTEICDLPRLKILDLSNNNLTELPTNLGDCDSALRISLSANQIDGSLPSKMTSGICLILKSRLDNNAMTGTIPTEIGNCDNLIQLVLASNNFSGPLPSELGQLIELESLDVHNNSLTGTIPSELGKWYHLKKSFRNISVASNQFEGTIPTELGRLTTLEYLDLSDNSFVGSVDEIFCSQTYENLRSSSLEEQEPIRIFSDCEEIECTCCITCCNETGCFDDDDT